MNFIPTDALIKLEIEQGITNNCSKDYFWFYKHQSGQTLSLMIEAMHPRSSLLGIQETHL